MGKFLRNIKDIEAFQNAIRECVGDVWLYKNDRTEQFNLKSTLSQYIALGRLCDEHGDEYEIFCQFPKDEGILLKYFYEH